MDCKKKENIVAGHAAIGDPKILISVFVIDDENFIN